MDEKQMLELAAKANWKEDLANEEVSLRYDEHEGGMLYLHADNQDHNGRDREFLWNPLTDDGDRYRLARKLGMTVDFHRCAAHALMPDGDMHSVFWGSPEHEAPCIVMLAARIGGMLP